MRQKRKSTREKILDTSIALFNEQGVETITTRHIGASINISQGNVHYHFPTKNAILEALFDRFLDLLTEAERFEGDILSKEDIRGSMVDSLGIMHAFRFFFRDNHVVWRRLPALKTRMVDFLEKKKSDIRRLIEVYRVNGMIRKEVSDLQSDFLAEQFIFSISAWPNAHSYQDIETPLPEHYTDFLFRMWLPYLKTEVMEDWESLLCKQHQARQEKE